jgi:hypothetical protein
MALYLSKPMTVEKKESSDSSPPNIVRDDIRLEVLLNCAHIIYQLGRAGESLVKGDI